MCPQKKQTDDQIYADLLEDMESLKDLPQGKGDNLELDEDDERIFNELYPADDQPPTEQADPPKYPPY